MPHRTDRLKTMATYRRCNGVLECCAECVVRSRSISHFSCHCSHILHCSRRI